MEIYMTNIILDRLPTEYKGYLIRTSFRIGIQISLCLQDEDYSEEERVLIALNLLYGNGMPQDLDVAMEGLNWFISCGNENKKGSVNDKQLFYWDFDNERIFSSFLATYGIDLTKEDMHWFKFIAMIGSLNKDCAFNKAIEIRDYDMKDLSGKNRIAMQKMKNALTPERKLHQEEQEALDEFNALFDGGDVNG